MTQCSLSKRCKFPWPELVETGWIGVRRCNSCNQPVFLSETRRDSAALGRFGLCVQLNAPHAGEEVFIGIIKDEPSSKAVLNLRRPFVLTMNETGSAAKTRALKGFSIYFSQLAEFELLYCEFKENGRVSLSDIPMMDSRIWSIRLADWNIETSYR